MVSILLIDDEVQWLKSLQRTLLQFDITSPERIFLSESGEKALDVLKNNPVDLVFLDLKMGRESGETLLKHIKEVYPEKTVVIMTGLTTSQPAITCMKLGADDYFTKTMKVEELVVSIKKIIKMKGLEIENAALKDEYLFREDVHQAFSEFITASPKMFSIFKYLQAVAPGSQSILITGESGVGKGVLAQAIVRLSRPNDPFISMNVAGLDEQMFTDTLFGHVKGAFTNAQSDRQGMIQQAKSGTVFLDEIGELPVGLQLKLLYLTQSGDYQPLGSDGIFKSRARFIFATNRDLKAKQEAGEFRKDLYYRLNMHHVHIPPLRERREDIPLLSRHFVKRAAEEYRVAEPQVPDNVIQLLRGYDFPGNVRQFRSAIYDAVAQCQEGILSPADFKKLFLSSAGEEKETVAVEGEIPTLEETFEIQLRKALIAAGGNQIKAAAILGVSQSTISRKMRKLKNGN